MYPNPNNGTFNLISDKEQKAVIINSLGQIINTIDLKIGENKVSELSSGIYIIQTNTQHIKIVVSN